MLVAGLSSTSGVELIDPAHLGIDIEGVTRFSYAGVGLPYGVEDTWQGVEAAALRLQQQLREQARHQPGRAVDLVGHSLGGVIIAHYLLHLHDPWDITLPPIGKHRHDRLTARRLRPRPGRRRSRGRTGRRSCPSRRMGGCGIRPGHRR